jgi:hypothetical protein
MSSQVTYAPVGTPASAPAALIPDPPWPEPVVRLAVGVRLAVPGLVLATASRSRRPRWTNGYPSSPRRCSRW